MNAPDLDPDLVTVVEQYRTCEFATISRSGVPIVWPTTPVRRPDGTFLITTSIGLPQKAFNVRRNPEVAMLFSDPTGSGVEGAPQLLVQGTAVCPEDISAGPQGAEELWRRLYVRQPASRAFSGNAVARWAMDWYYMRLYITVTPTAISTRPPLAPAPRTGGLPGAAAVLDRFSTVVLGVLDEDGTPRLLRANAAAGEAGAVTLDVPADAGVRPGPASLLGHLHDEQLWNQRTALVLGELAGSGGTWTFVPNRAVPGTGGGPLAMVPFVVGVRRTAKRYLERRGLTRPAVDWAAYEAVHD